MSQLIRAFCRAIDGTDLQLQWSFGGTFHSVVTCLSIGKLLLKMPASTIAISSSISPYGWYNNWSISASRAVVSIYNPARVWNSGGVCCINQSLYAPWVFTPSGRSGLYSTKMFVRKYRQLPTEIFAHLILLHTLSKQKTPTHTGYTSQLATLFIYCRQLIDN